MVVSGRQQWQTQDRGINLFPVEPRDTVWHCVTLLMSGHTFLHFISLHYTTLHCQPQSLRGWTVGVGVQVQVEEAWVPTMTSCKMLEKLVCVVVVNADKHRYSS